MPRQKKSARGKHRWIGFESSELISREGINDIFKEKSSLSEVKIVDLYSAKNKTIAIAKTPLSTYKEALDAINKCESLSTITSSGKIRLVRQRLSSI